METERKEAETISTVANDNAASAPSTEASRASELSSEPGKLIGNAERFNAATPATEKKPGVMYDDPHLQKLYENRHHKKGARIAFHAVNFGGLHQIFNNVASVVITYGLATTGGAAWMKDKMGTTPIGKGLSAVLTAPGKAVNGLFKLGGVDFNADLQKMGAAERKLELEFRAAKSNRSAIETTFMTIAGFITLMPVYYLENHRAGFLNKVDNWLHPGRSPKEKEASALRKEDEPKETIWNLFRARIVALAVVFGIDQMRDNFDSILKHKGKPNIDTIFGWGLGNKIYNVMPDKTRGWLARFFSGSMKGDNITLSSIQHEVRDEVLKITNPPEFVRKGSEQMKVLQEAKYIEQRTLGFGKTSAKLKGLETQIAAIDRQVLAKGGFQHLERAVFAEQSRLFLTKEVFLTTILSIVIYTATKWGPALKFFEKIGLGKAHHEQGEDAGKADHKHGKKHEQHARAAAPVTQETQKEETVTAQPAAPVAEKTAISEEPVKAADQKMASKLSDKLAPATSSYAEAAKARKENPGAEATVNI